MVAVRSETKPKKVKSVKRGKRPNKTCMGQPLTGLDHFGPDHVRPTANRPTPTGLHGSARVHAEPRGKRKRPGWGGLCHQLLDTSHSLDTLEQLKEITAEINGHCLHRRPTLKLNDQDKKKGKRASQAWPWPA